MFGFVKIHVHVDSLMEFLLYRVQNLSNYTCRCGTGTYGKTVILSVN